MKKLFILLKTFYFYMSTLGLSLQESRRISDVNRRLSLMRASSIYDKNTTKNMAFIYNIVGHSDGYSLSGHAIQGEHNPPAHRHHDSYFNYIKEEIDKHQLADHISIVEDPKKIYIAEKNMYYEAKYKVIVQDFVIPVSNYIEVNNSLLDMFFCSLPVSSSDDKPNLKNQNGIYLVFKNNLFIAEGDNTEITKFTTKERAYLIFENNIFKSVDLLLMTQDSSKVELESNLFIDSDVNIASSSNYKKDIVCLKNNVFYKNDNVSSELTIRDIGYYFKGKNTVDNLKISTDDYLNWGGYQNIDPQGKHAYIHKQMFIDLMKKAIQNNDKIQEAKLRRELLKCERTLILEEKTSHSSQDKFILWWSGLISDYGISWLRPLLWLTLINFFLMLFIVIVNFFNPECLPNFSSNKWWFLFTELFSPLSNLSNSIGIQNSGWISFLNIAQKALLAAAYYEIIKIFRRFSK